MSRLPVTPPAQVSYHDGRGQSVQPDVPPPVTPTSQALSDSQRRTFQAPPGVRVRSEKRIPKRFRSITCPFPLYSYFEGKHGAVHYSDDGPKEADAVIMLHGFNASRTMFTPIADFLASKGYFRAIAMDFYGCGLSNNPVRKGCVPGCSKAPATYSLKLFVAQIDELMQYLGIESAHFFGFSMGGAVAVAFAGAHPEKVRKLVLMSPAGFMPKTGLAKQQKLLKYFGCVVIPAIDGLIAWNPWYFSYERQVQNGGGWTQAMHRKVVWTMFVKRGTLTSMLDTLKNVPWFGMQEYYDAIAKHPRPVLLLWGSEDQVHPTGVRDHVAGLFENSTLRIIRNAGHIAHCERVNATVGEMVPFLHLPDDYVFQPHELGCGPSPGQIFTEVTGMTIQSLYPPPHGVRAVPTRARKGSDPNEPEPHPEPAGERDFQKIFTPGMQGVATGEDPDRPRRPEDITTTVSM